MDLCTPPLLGKILQVMGSENPVPIFTAEETGLEQFIDRPKAAATIGPRVL